MMTQFYTVLTPFLDIEILCLELFVKECRCKHYGLVRVP